MSTDILYDHFGFGHSAASGSGSVTVWPDRAAPHEITLSLGAVSSGGGSRATRGRSAAGSASARQSQMLEDPREYLFRVYFRCKRGEKLSPNNQILCVDASENVEVRTPGKETPVTTGALLAIDHVAEEAVQLYARPCSNGLPVKPRQIAALLVTIGIFELDMSKNNYVYRYPARSAMGLSRKDHYFKDYYSRTASGGFGPSRAFWHVGVGMFQLDDRFGDNRVNEISHAERADIYVGGRIVARHLVQKICEQPRDPNEIVTFASQAEKALRPWQGCTREGSNLCIGLTYPKLYIAAGDDLYVTNYLAAADPALPANPRVPPFPHDERENYSPLGGIKKMTCRWVEDRSDDFPCWFYDTRNPEGWYDRYLPDGAQAKHADPSPLAAPFFTFRTAQRRAIVFPASLLGSTSTWIASAPLSQRIEEVVAANAAANERREPEDRIPADEVDLFDWTTGKHDYGHGIGRTLEVRTRVRSPSTGGPACGWVSVNANSSALNGQNLARCLRYMYPNEG